MWTTEPPAGNKQCLVTVRKGKKLITKVAKPPFDDTVIAWMPMPEPYDPEDMNSVVKNDLMDRFEKSLSGPFLKTGD